MTNYKGVLSIFKPTMLGDFCYWLLWFLLALCMFLLGFMGAASFHCCYQWYIL